MTTSEILTRAAARIENGDNCTLLGAVACASEQPGDFTRAMHALRRCYFKLNTQLDHATMMLLLAAEVVS